MRFPTLANRHSPYIISTGGSLLFICVSLNSTGLFSAWQRGETSSAILAKPFSDCVTVLCIRQCKSRHLRICESLKRTCYFQTNLISYILNWDVRCLCCRWPWFHVMLLWPSSNCPHLIREPPLLRKLKSAFANKDSSLIQTVISFTFVEIYISEVTFSLL